MAYSIISILVYGFIFIIVMLVCIYHRLGKLLDTNSGMSITLDSVVSNLEKIENNIDDINADVSYAVQKQKDIDDLRAR